MRKIVLLLLCAVLTTGAYSQSTYRDEAYNVCVKYYCLLNNKKESQLKKTEKVNIWNNLDSAINESFSAYYKVDYAKAAELDSMFQAELADARLQMTEEEENAWLAESDYGKLMQRVKEICDSSANGAKSSALYDSACVFALEKIERELIIAVEPDLYSLGNQTLDFYLDEQAIPMSTKRLRGCATVNSKDVEGLTNEMVSGSSMSEIEWAMDRYNRIIVKSFVCNLNGKEVRIQVADSAYKPLSLDLSKAGDESGLVVKSEDCSLEKFYDKRAREIMKPWREKFAKEIYNVDVKDLTYQIQSRNDRSKDLEYCQSTFDEEIRSLRKNAEKLYKDKLTSIKDSLLRYDIERYVEVTKSIDPKIEPTLAKWMKDYICYEYSFDTLARIYLNGKAPTDSTCHEKYGFLFNSDEEYNHYVEEIDFMYEVNRRIDIYTHYQDHLYYIESNSPEMKFAGCMKDDGNEETVFIEISHIKCMTKYYSELIDVYMKYDKKMMKEYEKVGALFENTIEFFEMYIQEDYRKLLKELKQTRNDI